MRSRSINYCLIMTLAVGLSAQALPPAALAHPGQTHTKKKTAPATTPSFTHTKPKKIERKAKVNRTKAKAKTISAPLLSLQFWIEIREDDNIARWVDPNTTFNTGDQIRIGLKTNQPGFIYVINESFRQDDSVINAPNILFPDSRINDSSNVIQMNKEYFIPSYCEGIVDLDDPNDCWLDIDGPPGRDVFTIIFSRERIINLAEKAAKAGQKLDLAAVEELRAGAVKDLSVKPLEYTYPGNPKAGSPADQRRRAAYVTRVTNTNVKDNEEIVYKVEIVHRSEGRSSGK